jgi:hypothetical protein
MSHAQLSERIFEGQWRPDCVICKESLKLEESKANEYGQAVHEKCYVSQLLGGGLRLRAITRSAGALYVFRFPLALALKRGKRRP